MYTKDNIPRGKIIPRINLEDIYTNRRIKGIQIKRKVEVVTKLGVS